MENNIDKISRAIIVNSKLELPDTSFDIKVVKQIAVELQRKLRQKLFFLFLFIGAMLASSGYYVIRIFHINLKQPVVGSGGISDPILNSFRVIINVIIENEYLIFPLLLVLIIRRLVEMRLKYS